MLPIPLRLLRSELKCLTNFLHSKSFKNFGHKRESVPTFTLLWHGFLTFSFIGFGLNWKRIGTFFFSEDSETTSDLE